MRALRARQVRNFLATLLLSQGVPMLLAGDELGRTQGGNNNPYNQDNPISWLDWAGVEEHADLVRFTRELLALRRGHRSLGRREFFGGEVPGISWHALAGGEMDWSAAEAQLACWLSGPPALYLLFNSEDQGVDCVLPPAAGRWARLIDTTRASPADIVALDDAAPLDAESSGYRAPAHSLVVLVDQEA